jgi:DNA invertase Pin-like site-specific DNA recombinase
MVVVFAKGKAANTLWEFARLRGWDEHDDVTATGQLEELMRLAGTGKVSIVLAASLNGLASTVPELIAVVREFIERGIRLVRSKRQSRYVSDAAPKDAQVPRQHQRIPPHGDRREYP